MPARYPCAEHVIERHTVVKTSPEQVDPRVAWKTIELASRHSNGLP
jgi:hypothetical protein